MDMYNKPIYKECLK